MSKNAPNPSLFVRNLDNRIKKPELKRQLYVLFNAYGKVLDVVATRADGMRGQAFVVFQDLANATTALRALEGLEFYGKSLSIEYARTISKATLVDQHGPTALYDPVLLSQAKLGSNGVLSTASGSNSVPGPGKVTISSAQAESKKSGKRDREAEGNVGEGDEADNKRKKVQGEEGDSDEGEAMQMDSDSDSDAESQGERRRNGKALGAPLAAPGKVPNEVLFCGDVPEKVTQEALGVLFSQQKGYVSLQHFPAEASRKPPTAYALVAFSGTQEATLALEKMRNFKLASGEELSIGFAKRR
ncbi:hypothetical protein IE81DRAFT_326188 [Ceraceosorus guamensis]|uniref:RRM domain-containing protein n=1 Tax=Ceraceosorus guamensis TaxID=1522189 RepID=A0A316VQA6_9BASI|nr:hypothetical protein IE81DRAFT_326188 [Ceraceosorus guamensis]PWN39776.1 hypothetical protein IE81DRAFT_326188 [Ceraceosorus guamensis]